MFSEEIRTPMGITSNREKVQMQWCVGGAGDEAKHNYRRLEGKSDFCILLLHTVYESESISKNTKKMYS
jgi:hypothetical protein